MESGTNNTDTINEVLKYNEEDLHEWILSNGKPIKPYCPIYFLDDSMDTIPTEGERNSEG